MTAEYTPPWNEGFSLVDYRKVKFLAAYGQGVYETVGRKAAVAHDGLWVLMQRLFLRSCDAF